MMEEPDTKDNLIAAMRAAEKAFEKYFDDLGYESAYFVLDLKGYEVGSDFFSPTNIVEFKNYEVQKKANKGAKL